MCDKSDALLTTAHMNLLFVFASKCSMWLFMKLAMPYCVLYFIISHIRIGIFYKLQLETKWNSKYQCVCVCVLFRLWKCFDFDFVTFECTCEMNYNSKLQSVYV